MSEELDRFEREKDLILNNIDDLVVYHDPLMKILWANRAAEVSVNSAPGELIGRYCWEIWHGRNTPCPGCPVVLAIETGQSQKAEIRSPDGKEWFIRSYTIKNDDGTINGVVELCQDITERKLREEALKLTSFSLDHARDIILWFYPDGRLYYANDAACKRFGYTRDELLSLTVFNINPLYTRESWDNFWRKLRKEGFAFYETQNCARDGSCFPIEV